MKPVFVKLKSKEFRKIVSLENEEIYPKKQSLFQNAVDYTPEYKLEEDEWFKITNFSKNDYGIENLLKQDFDSVDFDLLTKKEFDKIDFLFTEIEQSIFFQNIPKSQLLKKKMIGNFGESFKYIAESKQIFIKEIPDAVYDTQTDALYFRKLESITGIFKGIDQLYREATTEETEKFLKNDFISLDNEYDVSKVKIPNRKRIALATDILNNLTATDKKNIFNYISKYCSDLKKDENSFLISSEADLKLILFGIQQRFYTTPVGNEKRIANSVIKL